MTKYIISITIYILSWLLFTLSAFWITNENKKRAVIKALFVTAIAIVSAVIILTI